MIPRHAVERPNDKLDKAFDMKDCQRYDSGVKNFNSGPSCGTKGSNGG